VNPEAGARTFMLVPAGVLALSLGACQPTEPPPDLLSSQRGAARQAQQLERQMQQQLDGRMQAAEDKSDK